MLNGLAAELKSVSFASFIPKDDKLLALLILVGQTRTMILLLPFPKIYPSYRKEAVHFFF